MVKLGDLVREKVTGFEGIVTGMHSWLTGCQTATVKPRKLQENGAPVESKSFDVPMLAVIESGAVVVDNRSPTDPTRPGGPKPSVARSDAR